MIEFIELICRRGDSNPHELPHTPLKRARLPVPPLRHKVCGLSKPAAIIAGIDSIKSDEEQRLRRLIRRVASPYLCFAGEFVLFGLSVVFAAGELLVAGDEVVVAGAL